MRILFWNLNGNKNDRLIAECLKEREIDIALFAEWSGVCLKDLSQSMRGHYELCEMVSNDSKVLAMAKTDLTVSLIREQSRYALYQISKDSFRFILAGIHLEDRRSDPQGVSRAETVRDLVADINSEREGNNRTGAVIVGDYNMEPYDPIMIDPTGFGAALFLGIVRERSKYVWHGKDRELLYNPMLCMLSENGPQYGSYYSTCYQPEIYWHCLDQVLVTPNLAERVRIVSYLRSIGEQSLISKVAPCKKISDHLPLLVDLGIEEEENGE